MPAWLRSYLAFYTSPFFGGVLSGMGIGCLIGRMLLNNQSTGVAVIICVLLTFLGERIAKQAVPNKADEHNNRA